jgi:hypothetical protein
VLTIVLKVKDLKILIQMTVKVITVLKMMDVIMMLDVRLTASM